MVFTLHRYIFRDLLRTFLTATAVLSLMLGLGVMLRPLQQFSVAPKDVPQLILCTLPVTLTMVMPIAALLSATLNYGRLAADNEISACRSSGIGLLTLIYPAVALALLVGVATLGLVFHVIPTYAQRFEAIIFEDIESIIYRMIDKKGNLGDFYSGLMVHADRADPENHRLLGVAALHLSDEGIDRIVTAEQVQINIDRGQEENRVSLRFVAPCVVDGQEFWSLDDLTLGVAAPNMYRDNIKFKKLSDLKRIQNDVTRFSPVQELLNEYRRQLLIERYIEWCDHVLQQTNGLLEVTQEIAGQQHRLLIAADQCQLKEEKSDLGMAGTTKAYKAELTGDGDWPVQVAYYVNDDNTSPEKVYYAKSGKLSVDLTFDRPQVTLSLKQLEWSYFTDDASVTELQRYALSGIVLPESLIADVQALPLRVVLDGADGAPVGLQQALPSAKLLEIYTDLREQCRDVAVEIEMELHSRLAFGFSCVVLVLLGAALGIIFRSGHLLMAFGVSFMPAALCLILIFTGKHVAEADASAMSTGIGLLWGGIVAVGIADAVIYRAMMRR